MKHLWAALCLLMVVSTAACYRIAGRPYNNISSVGVKVFTNKTLYRDVDFQLSDQLRREISALTFYTIAAPRDADAVLEGEVTRYEELPEAIDEDEMVTARRVVARAAYKLVDNRTGEIIASSGGLNWSEVFPVRTGRTLAQVREETLRKLAQKIVEHAFMPWPEAGDMVAENRQE